jgi:hypothetical protein
MTGRAALDHLVRTSVRTSMPKNASFAGRSESRRGHSGSVTSGQTFESHPFRYPDGAAPSHAFSVSGFLWAVFIGDDMRPRPKTTSTRFNANPGASAFSSATAVPAEPWRDYDHRGTRVD